MPEIERVADRPPSISPVPEPQIDDDRVCGWREGCCRMNDRVDDGATDARPFELGTRVNGRLRITGGERATVLRL